MCVRGPCVCARVCLCLVGNVGANACPGMHDVSGQCAPEQQQPAKGKTFRNFPGLSRALQGSPVLSCALR
eukprot:10381199-Alexandrium_andersonii.AAC.1